MAFTPKLSPVWVIVIIVVVIISIVFGAGAFIKHRTASSTYTGSGAVHGGYDDYDPDWEAEGGGRPFRLATREPWYEYATKGKKTVWGRLRTGPFSDDARTPLKVGDPVTVARSRAKGDETEYGKPYRYMTEIVSLKEYDTFKDLLKGEGTTSVFPGTKTDTAAMKVFNEFYDEAAQQGAKVLAIGVKPPTKEALKVAE